MSDRPTIRHTVHTPRRVTPSPLYLGVSPELGVTWNGKVADLAAAVQPCDCNFGVRNTGRGTDGPTECTDCCNGRLWVIVQRPCRDGLWLDAEDTVMHDEQCCNDPDGWVPCARVILEGPWLPIYKRSHLCGDGSPHITIGTDGIARHCDGRGVGANRITLLSYREPGGFAARITYLEVR